MAEPIGLVGLTLQLYIGCIHSYKLFLRARDRERDSSVLTTKMQIEEIRFESWGSLWGFTTQEVDVELAQDESTMAVILKTLQQIKAIFEDTVGLVTKYGLEQEFGDIELDENLETQPPERKRRRATGFSRVIRTGSAVIDRCRWAIVDREKFDGLVQDMKDFNDGLHNITLPAKERRSIGRAVLCAMGTDTLDATRLQVIEAASQTLGSSSTAEPYHSLHMITDFRLRASTVGESSLRISKEQVVLDGTAIALAAHNEPGIGIYNNTPVLVEWRPTPVSLDARTRIARLSSLLSVPSKPSEFHVLDLLAYFEDHDTHRLCFISKLPTPCALPPISLYHLLSRNFKIPPLGTRFRLAQILNVSVLQLHCSSWMHRRIRSSNILFFRNDARQPPDLSQPWITGFGYAHPDGHWSRNAALSRSTKNDENDLYRHPHIHWDEQTSAGLTYRREYDVFSLGMVLLEIGLWEQLRMLKIDRSDEAWLENLKQRDVKRLEYKCGSIYHDVVIRCLEGTKKPTENEVEEEEDGWSWEERKRTEQAWLYWDVLKELEKCNA